MRVLVTGASGYLGVAVAEELRSAGHDVAGLVRSAEGAARVRAAGGTAVDGDLRDRDLLVAQARDADAVAHLGWVAPEAGIDPVQVDREAIDALGEGLASSGRRLVVASGVLGLAPGRVVTEDDRASSITSPVLSGRAANGEYALGLVDRGVAPVLVRLAPVVHDDGRIKPGFAGRLVQIAAATGSAGYLRDGAMRWSAVHRLDAAQLFRLALEQAPAGAVLHGVGEQGVTQSAIADTIASGLHVPAVQVSEEEAERRFGWLAPLVALDAPASSAATRTLLGWEPSGPGLLHDLRDGVYFPQAQS